MVAVTAPPPVDPVPETEKPQRKVVLPATPGSVAVAPPVLAPENVPTTEVCPTGDEHGTATPDVLTHICTWPWTKLLPGVGQLVSLLPCAWAGAASSRPRRTN